MHYYDRNLRDRASLRRRLVAAILGALKDIRPQGWSVSEPYIAYMDTNSDEITWIPDLDYYIHLVRRIVESILFKSVGVKLLERLPIAQISTS